MARTSDIWPPPEDPPTHLEPLRRPPPPPKPPHPEPVFQPQPQLHPQSQLQRQPEPQPQPQPQPQLQPRFQRQLQRQPRLQPWPTSEHGATTSSPFSAAASGHCRGLSPPLSTSLSHAAYGHYGVPQQRVPAANFHPLQSSAAVDRRFHYYPPSITATSVNARQVYSGTGNESTSAVMSAEQLNDGVELVVNEEPEVEDKPVVNESETSDPYFNLFPPGWRFRPTDAELVWDYLKPKTENKELPKNRIKELNIYEHHPANLAATYEKCGDKEWYFFSPRDRKYKNGNRPARNADGGYWKATGADKEIISKSEEVIGSRKNLVFHDGKPQHGVKSDWMMHEYQYVDAPRHERAHENDMKLDDIVLCKIYKKHETNNNSKGRKRKAQRHHEEEGPKDEPSAPKNSTFNHYWPQQQQQPQPLQLQPQQHQQLRLPQHSQLQLSQLVPSHPQPLSQRLLRALPEPFHDLYDLRTPISGFGSQPYPNSSNHAFQSSRERNSGLLEDVVNTVRPGNGNDSSVVSLLAHENPGTAGSMNGTPEFDVQTDDEASYMNGDSEFEDWRNVFNTETDISMDFGYLEDEIFDDQNIYHTDHQSQNDPQLQ